MIHLFAISLAVAGFLLLAISMARHQQDMIGRKLAVAATQRARTGGYALLILVLVLDAAVFGVGYGAVVWFGHLSIGAWSVVGWLAGRAWLATPSIAPKK